MLKQIKKNWLLLAIIIVAAVLRFAGLYPGYNQFHPDEPVLWGGALNMAQNNTLKPTFYYYGALPIMLNAVVYKLIIPLGWVYYYLSHLSQVLDGLIKIPPTIFEAERILSLEIIGSRGINAIYWTRYITAIFGLATVFITYLLGKKIFNKKVGLLAALFLAFNFKHVVNSHIGLPDIYNSFFFVTALLASYAVWQNPTKKNYLWAGLASGLSLSVKYQIYSILPLLTAHFFANTQKRKWEIKKLFRPEIFMALVAIPLVFVLTNTFYLIDLETSTYQNFADVLRYGLGRNQLNLFLLSYLYHHDYGPPLFFVVFSGMFLSLFREPKKTLFLFSSLVIFAFIFFYYSIGGFFVRNIIAVTPVLMIFAAFLINNLFDFLAKRITKYFLWLVMGVVLAVLVWVPAKNSLVADYYFSKPWNYVFMGNWIRDNLPKDAVVAAEPFNVPTAPNYNKTEFEITGGSYSLAEHRENGAGWALVNLDWAGGPFYSWMSFGLKDLEKWNKPLDAMRDTFYGIAIEELFNYQVFSATKVWQAPGGNYVMAKLPGWPKVTMKEIGRFTFDSDFSGWQVYAKNPQDQADYLFDQLEGHNNSGAAFFRPGGTRFPNLRLTSTPVAVTAGKLYRISGWMKTERELAANEREGFLRVDFYEDNLDFNRLGQRVSLSARVWGSEEWQQKEIVVQAPGKAKWMTISFQMSNTSLVGIWLDDVVIEESEEVLEDLISKPPYQKREIDLNLLYPNSHGNL